MSHNAAIVQYYFDQAINDNNIIQNSKEFKPIKNKTYISFIDIIRNKLKITNTDKSNNNKPK